MINGIVFSKDRACQLNLLLESINKNAPGIFDLTVIYLASSEKFKSGYELIIPAFPNVKFIEQGEDFKVDVLQLLTDSTLTCFFTDDDIIYKPITGEDIIKSMAEDDDLFCFSLRMGQNVKFCYTLNVDNVLHNYEDHGRMIKWDWTVHYCDFGYPLSVDGHVFRTKEIAKMIRKVAFKNPNELEINLQIFDNFPKAKMASYKESTLVNTPNNIVNDVVPNRNAQTFGISAHELNKRLLAGEFIDLEQMDFSKVIGCHQEIEYKFKPINEQ